MYLIGEPLDGSMVRRANGWMSRWMGWWAGDKSIDRPWVHSMGLWGWVNESIHGSMNGLMDRWARDRSIFFIPPRFPIWFLKFQKILNFHAPFSNFIIQSMNLFSMSNIGSSFLSVFSISVLSIDFFETIIHNTLWQLILFLITSFPRFC